MVDFIYITPFGIAGFLIAVVLTRHGEVLEFWPKTVNFLIRVNRLKNPNRVQQMVIKITYGCGKCVAGQIAFWYSVIKVTDFMIGFTLVVCSIFVAYAIEKYYE